MATIRSVRWRPFSLPLRVPANAAHGVSDSREGLVIVLVDDDGRAGLGEASPLTSYAGGSVAECDAAMGNAASQLAGRSAQHAWDAPLTAGPGISPGGLAALSCGLETAVTDLLAGADGVPLYAWLKPGAPLDPTVPVNGLVDQPTAPEAAAEAARLAAAGFRTLKVKAGFGVELDSQRLAAIRGAIGHDITLRADANGAWDEATATTMLAICREHGISLLEQPVPPAAGVAALARLRRHFAGVQIAADEGCRSLDDFEALRAADAVDAIVVKPMASGLREALRIMDAAESARIPVIVTTTFDSGIGVTLAAHLAATLPEPRPACGLATHERLATDIVTGVLPVVCGQITLAPAPGLGLTLDLEALEEVATGPWREVVR